MERTSVIPASERTFNRASLLYSSTASTSSHFHYTILYNYTTILYYISERTFNRASLLHFSAASTSSHSLSFHYEIGRQYLELDSLSVPKHPSTARPFKAPLVQGSSRRPDTPSGGPPPPQNIQFVHVSPLPRCNLCLSFPPSRNVPTSPDVLLQKKGNSGWLQQFLGKPDIQFPTSATARLHLNYTRPVNRLGYHFLIKHLYCKFSFILRL